MKRIRKAAPVFDNATNILAVLSAIIIISVMLAISLAVATRYFLKLTWTGLIELSAMSLLFVTFLGATWVLRKGGHVTMDVLVDQLNPRSRSLLNIITSILCALICLVLIWYGAQVTWTRYLEGSWVFANLTIPDAYFLFIIPVGSFFLFIQFLRRTYGYLERWRDAGKPEAEGVEETRIY